MQIHRTFDHLQQSLAAFFCPDGQPLQKLSEQCCEPLVCSWYSGGWMNFDDLIAGSSYEDLQFSRLIERTVQQGEQALVSNIWSIFSRVFVQFIRDVVRVVIAIKEDVLVLFESAYLQWSFLQNDYDFLIILLIFLQKMNFFHIAYQLISTIHHFCGCFALTIWGLKPGAEKRARRSAQRACLPVMVKPHLSLTCLHMLRSTQASSRPSRVRDSEGVRDPSGAATQLLPQKCPNSWWAFFLSPLVNSLGQTSVPTRLMPTVKQWLAMAALRAQMPHSGSESPLTVAEGLKTISAPLSAKPSQCRGWCLPQQMLIPIFPKSVSKTACPVSPSMQQVDSLKSPTRGMCPFSCLPRMAPWLSMTTALLCRVSFTRSLSRMEETITTLCFCASSQSICVDSPSRASANSTHGYRSRVHIKKGAAHISCKPITFAPSRAAISMILLILSMIALFCSRTGFEVSSTILFCTAAILTLRGGLICSVSHSMRNCFTSTSISRALSTVFSFRGTSGVSGPQRI